MNLYKSFFKHFFDLILAILGFILLLPLIVLITIVLYWKNDGTPFFLQARPGKNGKIFKIIKFKSMTDKTDSFGNLLPENERLTAAGRFVRKYSLDEIPQLINVIKGDMSLIGPRPLLVHYLPLYNDTQKHRHDIKPGISGWAQVNGRNAISWEKKFELDVWYVNNLSFFLDFKIILLTIYKVFKKEDIYSLENDIVTEFRGE
ncbi:sugar transferase [Formosa agariphila KMM 3901]|uniref:Sugar transferase n=1 Tax=Formosa agariphila (strain DSM 15362 / KCTC 12365 / LMG 23005 / KMM 3901 / M-2Alg 35-1) TaxID=1347342 RepID=T2KM95_FORAG|nr:sugar transferase [Formosa agariphila]CDF80017.1 sugar transferase [Formosa agariphila KMM 3901]